MHTPSFIFVIALVIVGGAFAASPANAQSDPRSPSEPPGGPVVPVDPPDCSPAPAGGGEWCPVPIDPDAFPGSAWTPVPIGPDGIAAAHQGTSTVPIGPASFESSINHQAQTCKGSGEDRECLVCLHYDGGKDCWWIKSPESKSEGVIPNRMTAAPAGAGVGETAVLGGLLLAVR